MRGDRHHTTSYSARTLTNWGFNEAQYDFKVNHGCVLYKLFLGAFPHHFKGNSVYAHYPMVIPSETLKIQKDLKRDHLFDWSRPKRQRPTRGYATTAEVKDLLGKPEQFRSSWHSSLQSLLSSGGSKQRLSTDDHENIRQQLHEKLYTAEVHSQVKEFYRQTTERLLDEASYTLGGRRFVDVVRDVGNIVPVDFAARMLNLPLDSKDNKKGIYKPHELYAVLSLLNLALYQVPETSKVFPIQQAAHTVATQLATVIESGLKGSGGYFANKSLPVSVFGAELVKGLAKGGKDAAWTQILPTAAALVPTQATVVSGSPSPPSRTVCQHDMTAVRPSSRLLLDPQQGSRALHPDPRRCLPAPQRRDRRPASRLCSGGCPPLRQCRPLPRVHPGHHRKDGRRSRPGAREDLHQLCKTLPRPLASPIPGPRLTPHQTKTSKDAHCFPDPDAVNPSRPLASYAQYNVGPHAVLGTQLSQAALTEMFRAVMKRKGLARARGPQGELKKIVGKGGRVEYLREDWGAKTPFPVTMKVTWDV